MCVGKVRCVRCGFPFCDDGAEAPMLCSHCYIDCLRADATGGMRYTEVVSDINGAVQEPLFPKGGD